MSRTSRPTQYGIVKHPRVAKPHSKNYHHHLKDHRRGTKTMKRRTSFRSTVKARRHFGGHPQTLTETTREREKKKKRGMVIIPAFLFRFPRRCLLVIVMKVKSTRTDTLHGFEELESRHALTDTPISSKRSDHVTTLHGEAGRTNARAHTTRE